MFVLSNHHAGELFSIFPSYDNAYLSIWHYRLETLHYICLVQHARDVTQKQ